MKEQKLAEDNLILKVVTGSHLYGFNTNKSDVDYQGIFIPPKQYVYGLQYCDEVRVNTKTGCNSKGQDIAGQDYVCYNLIKFIKLARNNNPNIISIFYTPQNRICFKNKYGNMLLENAHLFLSKKAYHTYRGYAHQQKSKLLSKNPIEGSKRKELVDEYGYDTKYACHLIRLLYECLEILVEKKVTYPLVHAKELLKIRNGEYDLDYIFSEAHRLEELVDEAYVGSDLQHSSNNVEIEKLQMNILKDFWFKDKYTFHHWINKIIGLSR